MTPRRLLPLTALLLILAALSPSRAVAAPWSSTQLVATADTSRSAGRVGDAQLALQRARLLDPGTAVAEELPDVPTSPLLGAHQWSKALVLGAVLTGLGTVLLLGPRRQLGLAIGLLGAALVTASATSLELASGARRTGIALEETAVHMSPAASSPVDTHLEPGAVARLGERHGEFVYVTTDHGSGWAVAANVPMLAPSGG